MYLKKIVYILLLVVMLLQAGGMLLMYRIQQFKIQYEMKLVINDSETSFERLILSVSEYRKSQLNSREISYQGNMYDVKSVTITGDVAELLVINDIKEKFLLKEIKDFLRKSNESKKELPDKLQKFLSINYISVDEGRIIYIPSFCFNIFHYSDFDINTNISDTPSPPPKLG
jgi:hypothetical protein